MTAVDPGPSSEPTSTSEISEARFSPVSAFFFGAGLVLLGILLVVHGAVSNVLADVPGFGLDPGAVLEALVGAALSVTGVAIVVFCWRRLVERLRAAPRLRRWVAIGVVAVPLLIGLWILGPLGRYRSVDPALLLPRRTDIEQATGLTLRDKVPAWRFGDNQTGWSVANSTYSADVLFEVRKYATPGVATLVDVFRWARDPTGPVVHSPIRAPAGLGDGPIRASNVEVRCVAGTGTGCSSIVSWARYGQYLVRIDVGGVGAGDELEFFPSLILAWHQHIGQVLGGS